MESTPILFLPGLMCDDRVFKPQIDYLNKISYPYTVADFSQGNSIKEMAKFSFELTSSRGWKNFYACGLSMGGIVAMEMMAWPEVVGAILIDTNHLADTEERKIQREKQNHRVIQGWFKKQIKEMKPFYLSEQEGENARKLWELFHDMAISLGEEAFIRQNSALRDRESYEEILKIYEGPCLLICGEKDILCPPERHQSMSKLLRNSEIHIIPQAGHISNLEKPVEVNRILGEWLKKY